MSITFEVNGASEILAGVQYSLDGTNFSPLPARYYQIINNKELKLIDPQIIDSSPLASQLYSILKDGKFLPVSSPPYDALRFEGLENFGTTATLTIINRSGEEELISGQNPVWTPVTGDSGLFKYKLEVGGEMLEGQFVVVP